MLQWNIPNYTDFTRLDDFSKALHLDPTCLEIKVGDFGFTRFLDPE